MIRGSTPLIRQPGEVRIHLDTDLGGDTDDAFALAMLLGWPGVEITGITTVADPGGRRAAYVEYLLRLAGREEIPGDWRGSRLSSWVAGCNRPHQACRSGDRTWTSTCNGTHKRHTAS